MGVKDLPLAGREAHASAFRHLGWTRDTKRRGRGTHILMFKAGVRAVLSIPPDKVVKRTIIAAMIKLAGVTVEQYLDAFHDGKRKR